MKIETKRTASFIGVKIIDGGTTIDLGLLNDDERDELARELVEAVWAIGPNYNNACAEWFADMLGKSGIELPNSSRQTPTAAVGSLDGVVGNDSPNRSGK